MVVATLALALAATPASSTAPAEGQPVPLEVRDERHCLPEIKACFAVVPDPERGRGAVRLAISAIDKPGDAKHERLAVRLDYEQHGDDQSATLWTHALAMPANEPALRGWLIGVLVQTAKTYSGGQAATSRLHLYPLIVGQVGGIGPELASLPWASEINIRACFDDDDIDRRKGVCHDSYTFGASLILADQQEGDDLPVLVYRAQATAFPQTARRWEGSSAAPPLRDEDLSHWTDFECTYQRTLRFNPSTDRYEMDRPAPDCRAYYEP